MSDKMYKEILGYAIRAGRSFQQQTIAMLRNQLKWYEKLKPEFIEEEL